MSIMHHYITKLSCEGVMKKWKINRQLMVLVLLGLPTSILYANTAISVADKNVVEKSSKLENGVKTGFEELDAFIASQKIDKSNSSWKTQLNKPPKLPFDKNKHYFWVLETNKGVMEIKFMPKIAPMHVSSTMYLTRLGFYDNTIFHRVIQGFMAQGGDPLGTGRGGPGYTYQGEFQRYVTHNRGGLLSMANAGPGTDGSQFFLTFVATPHLNGKHSIFGEIVKGQDTLRKLEARGSRSGATREPLRLIKASIRIE